MRMLLALVLANLAACSHSVVIDRNTFFNAVGFMAHEGKQLATGNKARARGAALHGDIDGCIAIANQALKGDTFIPYNEALLYWSADAVKYPDPGPSPQAPAPGPWCLQAATSSVASSGLHASTLVGPPHLVVADDDPNHPALVQTAHAGVGGVR